MAPPARQCADASRQLPTPLARTIASVRAHWSHRLVASVPVAEQEPLTADEKRSSMRASTPVFLLALGVAERCRKLEPRASEAHAGGIERCGGRRLTADRRRRAAMSWSQ